MHSDAAAYMAQLERILQQHNSALGPLGGSSGTFEGAEQLRSALRIQEEALAALRQLKENILDYERGIRQTFAAARYEAPTKRPIRGRHAAASKIRDTRTHLIAQKRNEMLRDTRRVRMALDDLQVQMTRAKGVVRAALAERAREEKARVRDRDMTSQLSRLAGLHKAGALTDVEFRVAKAKLLGENV